MPTLSPHAGYTSRVTAPLTLATVAKSPASWPAPALLAQLLVLLLSGRPWADTLPSRGEPVVVAHLALGLAAVLTVAYAGTFMPRELLFLGTFGWRRHRPSEAEKVVLVWLIRATLLLALYGGAWLLVRRYAFGA